MKSPVQTGTYDAVLHHIGLTATVNLPPPSSIKQHPDVMKENVFAWVDAFETETRGIDTTCESMYAQYEPELVEYGYSFNNMKRVLPTLHLMKHNLM